MSKRSDIALVTATGFGLVEDDRHLVDALAERGLVAEACVWDDPGVDWSAYRLCLLRSTWDYFFRLEEFLAWTRRAAAVTQLQNDVDLVAWNSDKRYLADLGERGVPLVETAFVEAGSDTTLAAVLEEHGWRKAIVKPAVDGGAKRLFTVNDGTTGKAETDFRHLLGLGVVLVQPFLESVAESGELSLLLIEGELTHAVLKRPAAGDFRVQPEWGGSATAVVPQRQDTRTAEAVIEALGGPPLYARVDLVHEGGEPRLMELEAIEPRMFLGLAPTAAERFAEAIMLRVEDPERGPSREGRHPRPEHRRR